MNAHEVAFWNGPATLAWSEQHAAIDRLFADVTQAAIERAAPQPGERVLDIGCGSGTTVLELAARVAPGGAVVGADVSEASVVKARERIAAGAGLRNAEVLLADASVQRFEPHHFDLVFSRFGVMFFDDPVASFINLRSALKPGGRLALAVFRAPRENHWSAEPLAAIRELVPPLPRPGPDDPGQFSWADPARVQRILESAGFREISLTPHDPMMRFAGPGGAAEAAAFTTHVGPAARAMQGAPPERRDVVRAALEAFFAGIDGPAGIALPGAVWIVRARV